ncbi:ASCH domain-containing protein [Sporosarcina sp. Marseille-Q4063]|uniref:ASCH domain-containing protein n=1 Tax=Sporosarcina sp. Marseille-Q4063 TaxID=2810514 RepID=UPI001BB0344C|nr:ASCH domain-containing protein [Sporosarcina sp. Marseille-Q4063]QUW22827.1 ASCH domain-containing protein [Sporosarcina sp. Marseille-Q4063]
MTNQTNDNLPEKSCSIERLVTIEADVEKVLNGEKTATRRNGVYAHPGEIMVLKYKEFKVDAVYAQTLGEMTDEDAKTEGYTSMEDYKESILALHPKMPWIPKMSVWVHEFSPVKK